MLPILFILFLVVVAGTLYNILIARKNDVVRNMGSIDVLLKKRNDLLPNLLDILKKYMSYESGLLTEVTELRSKASAQGLSPEERIQLDTSMSRKLGNLLAVAENYPDLKANQNYAMLNQTWKELEDQLANARISYNASVTRYNNAVEMFPTNLIATVMNYKTKPLYEVGGSEKENVRADDYFQKQ